MIRKIYLYIITQCVLSDKFIFDISLCIGKYSEREKPIFIYVHVILYTGQSQWI